MTHIQRRFSMFRFMHRSQFFGAIRYKAETETEFPNFSSSMVVMRTKALLSTYWAWHTKSPNLELHDAQDSERFPIYFIVPSRMLKHLVCSIHDSVEFLIFSSSGTPSMIFIQSTASFCSTSEPSTFCQS